MKKFATLALSVALVLSLGVIKAQAAIIVVFGQATGLNLFTGNETAGVTVLDANGIPVTITTLNQAASGLPAFFSLDAISTAPVVNQGGGVFTQTYSGSFSILSAGGFNYLSGTFNGVSLGIQGGDTLIFGAAEPPLMLDFTSDVVGMPLNNPTAMALALTNIGPQIQITNNSFADFTSSVAGNFSAEQLSEVPEPASLLLMGTGLMAVARRAMKNRKNRQI